MDRGIEIKIKKEEIQQEKDRGLKHLSKALACARHFNTLKVIISGAEVTIDETTYFYSQKADIVHGRVEIDISTITLYPFGE